MSETKKQGKHTPIPVPLREAEFDPHYIRGNNDQIFAVVHCEPESAKELANAVILSVNCHEELLEALRKIIRELEFSNHTWEESGRIATKIAQRAIAKAEGHQ